MNKEQTFVAVVMVLVFAVFALWWFEYRKAPLIEPPAKPWPPVAVPAPAPAPVAAPPAPAVATPTPAAPAAHQVLTKESPSTHHPVSKRCAAAEVAAYKVAYANAATADKLLGRNAYATSGKYDC